MSEGCQDCAGPGPGCSVGVLEQRVQTLETLVARLMQELDELRDSSQCAHRDVSFGTCQDCGEMGISP